MQDELFMLCISKHTHCRERHWLFGLAWRINGHSRFL
uniref:Uncharacterized protein n=1 Tax=Manihot esculenta TaxID=3983 RepID=A0A2C9U5H8_MANES